MVMDATLRATVLKAHASFEAKSEGTRSYLIVHDIVKDLTWRRFEALTARRPRAFRQVHICWRMRKTAFGEYVVRDGPSSVVGQCRRG